MQKYKEDLGRELNKVELSFIKRLSTENWSYIRTVTDTIREPILILNKDLRVLAANESFYDTFQVKKQDTERALVYELGNGQWNIPALRKLLEDILPKNTFFKGFGVTHEFPIIGNKSMLLNARQINFKNNHAPALFPPIMFLAIEDITPLMIVAETVTLSVRQLAHRNAKQIHQLETYIKKLEKDILNIKVHKK